MLIGSLMFYVLLWWFLCWLLASCLAITTLSKAGEEAFTPHIATISVFLFRAFNNHKTLATEASTSTNTNTSTRNTRRAVFLQEALVTLCATPVPGVFTRVVSAFLHEFNHTHWLAVDAIEHVLEVLIRVASDKLRHQTKISSSLLTHVHNTLAESSLLFHSSASKSCVFTPSIGRLTSKLTLGSEQSLRQFSNKCDILERILQFALTSLKFENSFQSYHPYRSLFEQDWANLLRVVIYCVQHEDKRAEAQIMHSALSEEVHKHAAVLRPVIYVDPSVNSVGMSGLNPADDPFSPSTSSLVPRILHLVLECMHELVKSSAACAASSVLAIHKILAELGRNDIAHHSRRGSVLSRKIRVMLLFYLNAVTEWLVRPHSNPLDMASNTFSPLALPPVCLSRGLTNMQLCQACVYVRSEDRSTQHLAGMFLQRLMDAEPRIQPTHSNKSKSRPCLGIASPLLLGTALVAHGEQGQGQGQGQGQLAVRLLRNTIFNVLVRQGERTGLHGLRVILAWELQVGHTVEQSTPQPLHHIMCHMTLHHITPHHTAQQSTADLARLQRCMYAVWVYCRVLAKSTFVVFAFCVRVCLYECLCTVPVCVCVTVILFFYGNCPDDSTQLLVLVPYDRKK